MKRIAVTGATGLIGRHLIAALRARGDDVVALSRLQQVIADVETAVRDPSLDALPAAARDNVEVIVNSAGAGIGDGRWSRHRRPIIDSCVNTTRHVVAALGDGGPTTLINASAIGFYGPTDDAVAEDAPAGHDFLAEVRTTWEQEAQRGEDRARVVPLRTGIVLSAATRTLGSVDEIRVEAAPAGSIITYDATLELRGVPGIADPLLRLAFGRIGDRAGTGLQRACGDKTPSES